MSLELALAALRQANRIDGTRASYRKDNPGEYAKVMDYLDGGARPAGADGFSFMGQGLVWVEDARRGVTPPPPPPHTGDWFPSEWYSGPCDNAIFKAAMPPKRGCLVGITDVGFSGIDGILQRESQIGRKFDVGLASYYGSMPNSDNKATLIRQGGRHIFLDAGHYGANAANEIINGSKDSFIRNWVKAASACNPGGPVFVRHFHEYAAPNMVVYYIDAQKSRRCTPDEWKAMCKRPVDIAKQEGISNIVWIWCPTTFDDRQALWASYPGDDYVDMVGDDNYKYKDDQWNGDVIKDPEHWEVHNYPRRMTPQQEPNFRMLHDAYPNKPFCVAETGCIHSSARPGRKAQWLRNMISDSPIYLNRMVMHIYSDYDDSAMANWKLDTTPDSLAAYKDVVNAPYFNTRS